jgi:predicted transcriptional regulator
MSKKRERLEVIHDILDVIRENGNDIKPTRLLHFSNISPQMFREYIDELLGKGFIIGNEKASGKTYSLTRKGFSFLENYSVIQDFISNFGL